MYKPETLICYNTDVHASRCYEFNFGSNYSLFEHHYTRVNHLNFNDVILFYILINQEKYRNCKQTWY